MTGAQHGVSSASRRSILPLPEDVVAQIKSSTAIVSLSGVVLELLKNALDAKATKIEATIDFARGACTVEDDGLGVPPVEFREEGGLGKLYCTSKHETHEALLGGNGTFLASLSAVSLLSITSRHHELRSHNSVTFHHAQPIERQTPASSHHEIHGKHGTRVTVRNLFGNLPVRVKQRSKVLEQKTENDRLWGELKSKVAGLLLSWAGSASVRARDADNRLIFNFNTSDSKKGRQSRHTDASKPRSAHLVSILNVLTQANYITVDEWATWVPISASTSTLSIKGAISLEPVPTKNVQFISLGVRPLTAEVGHNELYDQVNLLFARSDFGAIEDDPSVNDLEKVRRQTDKRFKTDVYIMRQMRTRKGVDKYPMFHLRIMLRQGAEAGLSEDRFIDDEANIQSIVDVLNAMVTQWLSAHQFRPAQHREKRMRVRPLSTPQVRPTSQSSSLGNRTTSIIFSRNTTPSELGSRKVDASDASGRKRKRDSVAGPDKPVERLQCQAFAEWSRIKSGKSDFFLTETTLPERARVERVASPRTAKMNAKPDADIYPLRPVTTASFVSQSVAQGSLNSCWEEQPEQMARPTSADSPEHDKTILWTDPLTKKTHVLNARTGCVMPQTIPRPGSGTSLSMANTSKKGLSKSLRLPPNATSERKPWLDGVLKTWDNPVFQASEKRIEQVSSHEHEMDPGQIQLARHRCSRFDMDKAFNGQLSSGSTRLSKESLRSAEVISQVDKKFVLVKVKGSVDATSEDVPATLLILIDQHAADERVQVEALFRELCAPVTPSAASGRYKSKLGHSALVASTMLDKPIQFAVSEQERSHFVTYAERFAQWGVLFDVLEPLASSGRRDTSVKEQHRLSVTALPPSVSERCKSDAGVLITFLRSTVWKYASNPLSAPHTSITADESSPNWVKRLSTCPEALIELVNSRACRTAIMFNDVLGIDECKQLVQRLAQCVFPFMCAHGRPSMVPLVDFGSIGDLSSSRDGSFLQAWKQWKR